MQPEEVHQLSASGGFTGAHKFMVSSKRIDRAGFACIGTSSESDFSAPIGRALNEAGRTS
jgi:hypothetical protein